MGFDVDLDLNAEPAPGPLSDVVMLADNELTEVGSLPSVPSTTVPLLAALSVDLAAATTAASATHAGADWRSLLGPADASKGDGVARVLSKKLWIGALAIAVVGAAWAVFQPGTSSSKPKADASARPQMTASAPTQPTAKAGPSETIRPEPPRPENVEQAVAPGSSILAAAPANTGSTTADVGPAAQPAARVAPQRSDDSAHSQRPAAEPRHAPAPQAAAPVPAPAPAPAPVETAPAAPKFAPPPEAPLGPAFSEVDVAPPFDQGAAMQALRDAGDAARSCRSGDTPSGAVRLSVTFARTGQVAQASIEDAALGATAVGSCIVSRFRAAAVPPFRGSSMTVRKTVNF